MEVEPENAAAKSMHAEALRNEQRSERKAKRMSQKMFSAKAMERDPRVPPTQWEVFLEYVRTAPAELQQFLRELPHQCRATVQSWLATVRQQWRAFVQIWQQKLETLGLMPRPAHKVPSSNG